jgi:hypothetical protein
VAMRVRPAEISDQHELAKMRHLLWPESSAEEHHREQSGKYGTLPIAILVSHDDEGTMTDFSKWACALTPTAVIPHNRLASSKAGSFTRLSEIAALARN